MSRINQIAPKKAKEDLFIQSYEQSLLFPIRRAVLSQLDDGTNLRLYKALTCSICKQLWQAPVYLKCSHRFCRACIERRIRSGSNKTCPICLTPLFSKRELRTDDFAIDFCDLAFGHLTSPLLQTTINEGEADFDDAEIKRQADSTLKIRRRYRKRPESLESQAVANPPKKRICRNNPESPESDPNFIYPKLQTYISNSFDEEEEDNQKKYLNGGSIKGNVKLENENNVKMQNGSPNSTENQGSSQEASSISECGEKQKDSRLIRNQNSFEQLKNSSSSFQQQVYITIRLIVHPAKITTPLLDFSEIQCPLYSHASIIAKLISQHFNLCGQEYVQLYMPMEGDLRKVSPQLTLAVINQYYSRPSRQKVYDLSIMIENLKAMDRNKNAQRQTVPALEIYFSVELGRQDSDEQPQS